MKNIKLLKLEKYNDSSAYQEIETGIYKDLKDSDPTNIKITLSFELEPNEDDQYPIEDILDKYYLHVSEFIDSTNDSILNLELAGELEDILAARVIIGKRVYNKICDDKYVELVIE